MRSTLALVCGLAFLKLTDATKVLQSIAFDPFRLQCPKSHATTEINMRMVDSAGGRREDLMYTVVCENLNEMFSDVDVLSLEHMVSGLALKRIYVLSVSIGAAVFHLYHFSANPIHHIPTYTQCGNKLLRSCSIIITSSTVFRNLKLYNFINFNETFITEHISAQNVILIIIFKLFFRNAKIVVGRPHFTWTETIRCRSLALEGNM